MRIAVDGRSLTRERRGVAHYLTSLLDALQAEDPSIEFEVVARSRSDVALRRPFGAGAHVAWAPSVAPLSVAKGIPLVLTVQDRSFELRPSDFTPYERLWHVATRPQALARQAAIVLTTTEHGRRDLVGAWGLDPAQVRAIPLAPAVPVRARAIDRHDPYFLFVGAFEPRKGVDVLAAAARIAGVRVIAVGSGRLAAPGLETRTGVDDEALSHLYAGALALVAPSRLEGFGLPAVEALAHGTPAIVTDLPEVREATRGRATYVPVDDAPALARAMQAHLAPRSVEPLRLTWQDAARDTLSALRDAAR